MWLELRPICQIGNSVDVGGNIRQGDCNGDTGMSACLCLKCLTDKDPIVAHLKKTRPGYQCNNLQAYWLVFHFKNTMYRGDKQTVTTLAPLMRKKELFYRFLQGFFISRVGKKLDNSRVPSIIQHWRSENTREPILITDRVGTYRAHIKKMADH
jgi:hypothetical protein